MSFLESNRYKRKFLHVMFRCQRYFMKGSLHVKSVHKSYFIPNLSCFFSVSLMHFSNTHVYFFFLSNHDYIAAFLFAFSIFCIAFLTTLFQLRTTNILYIYSFLKSYYNICVCCILLHSTNKTEKKNKTAFKNVMNQYQNLQISKKRH